MKATVNGESKDLRPSITVVDLLVELGHEPRGRGVAVALNGEVLPKTVWDSTTLNEDDRVEILVATQGG